MRANHIITINNSKCVGCGLCVKDCPDHNIYIEQNKAIHKQNDCLMCTHCLSICPENAVSISNFEDVSEDLASFAQIEGESLLQLVKRRRSVRQFTSKPVSDDLIQKLLQAGQYTPSASNEQDVSYVVIRENIAEYELLALDALKMGKPVVEVFSEHLKKSEIDDHFFFKNAPLVIVVKAVSVVNGVLAAASMELTANAFGLGVFYSGYFSIVSRFSAKLKRKLGLKKNERVAATLVIGHPAVRYQRTSLKERPEVMYD